MARFLNDLVPVARPHVSHNNPAQTMADYAFVPRSTLRGSWPLIHSIPEDTVVHLAVLANQLPKRALKQLRSKK